MIDGKINLNNKMSSYIEEKLYSQAFEEGFNYAIEKMFGEKEDDSTSSLAAGAAGGAIGTLGGVAAGVVSHKRHLKDHFVPYDTKTGKKINPSDIDWSWDLYRKVRKKALENEKTKKIWREQLREHITPRAAVGFGVGTLADIGYNSYMKNKKKERD